jgi:hypothetical protein
VSDTAAAPETVVEAIAVLRALGYTADAEIRGDALRCSGCESDASLTGLVADHVYRFEGMSNPDDEAIVVGVTCPSCDAKGVLVSAYGPSADPDELAGVQMIAERYAG